MSSPFAPPPTLNPTRASFYRPELDLLRFGAFLLVFLHHALPHASAGYTLPRAVASVLAGVARAGALGVDLFFTLSAYLITELLLRERGSFGTIDVRRFYVRRILRIWPLYYFALLILAPSLSLVTGERLPWSDAWMYAAAFALFGGNWACAAWGYPPSSFALLWSVSVEEQFYVTWPWIARLGRRRLQLFAGGMLAAAAVTRVVLVTRGVLHPGIWCNTLARLDPIAGGALLAAFLAGSTPVHSRRARISWIGCGALLLLIAGAAGANDGWAVLVTYPAAAAASVALLYGTLGTKPPSGASPGIYLGKISYGLYVFHAAAIRVVQSPVLALPVTIALAALSYRYLESPFLRLKDRFARIRTRAV